MTKLAFRAPEPPQSAHDDLADERIQVILCCNPAYFPHTAVTLVSLAETATRKVCAHVFTCDHDPVGEARLEESLRPYAHVELRIHHIDAGPLDDVFVDRHLTKETYLRVVAADALSQSRTRAIYLDSDIVVTDDISQLWALDLGGKLVGGVADVDIDDSAMERQARLGLPQDQAYINAGVLLIDLVRWRTEDVTRRVLCYASGRQLTYHDQDALNMVLSGDIHLLPTRWNVQAFTYSRKLRRARPDYFMATREARQRPGIVHYTSSAKPWSRSDWCRRKGLYRKFAARTAWRGLEPPIGSAAARLAGRADRMMLALGVDLTLFRHVANVASQRLGMGGGKMTGPGEPIHVAFCADRSYMQHAAVAAVSLLENSPGSRVHFHFVTCDDEPVAEARLAATLARYGRAALSFHRVDPDRIAAGHADRHVTKAAYLRFVAPDVLPADIRRIVYLDCDVVVVDDIRELADWDLSDHAVGACPDADWTQGAPDHRLLALGLAPEHTYVLSGMLVMDLPRWRARKLTERIFACVERLGAQLRFHDQDAFNVALGDEIALIDKRWNLQAMVYGGWFRRNLPGEYLEIADARRRPGVIHYSTSDKPWRFRSRARKRAAYFRYLAKTDWRGARPVPSTAAQCLEYDLARSLARLGIDLYMLPEGVERLRRRLAAGFGSARSDSGAPASN